MVQTYAKRSQSTSTICTANESRLVQKLQNDMVTSTLISNLKSQNATNVRPIPISPSCGRIYISYMYVGRVLARTHRHTHISRSLRTAINRVTPPTIAMLRRTLAGLLSAVKRSITYTVISVLKKMGYTKHAITIRIARLTYRMRVW